MLKYIAFFIIIFLLYGCPVYECYPVIKGRVHNKNTGQPIDNVLIQLENTKSFTNHKGIFKISESGCGKLYLAVSKKGYKPFEMKISNSEGFNTYEVKSISDWIDYSEPFYPEIKDTSTYMTGTWINKYSEDFQILSDSVIVYLEPDNLQEEIKNIKNRLRKTKME